MRQLLFAIMILLTAACAKRGQLADPNAAVAPTCTWLDMVAYNYGSAGTVKSDKFSCKSSTGYTCTLYRGANRPELFFTDCN